MSYKPSLARFIHDICSVLIVFIIIYFMGITIHNLFFSILFAMFGIIIIMSLIYLPIALWNENRNNFRTYIYGYYYLMIFIYMTLFSTLFILKVMYK